jgi:hypothetical protein
VFAGNKINVNTSNSSLIGSSINIFLRGFDIDYPLTSISTWVPFTVEILNPCANTVIQLTFSTLNDMNYVISQTASTQNFALGTDSKSALTGVSSLCGPIEYLIVVPGYSFASVDAVNGIISVQSNLINDAGNHDATFRAKMRDYSLLAHVDIGFKITITNPCLTTVLNLPTSLTSVTITSLSGTSNSQTFLPATNTPTTSLVPGLCGNRIYSIVEASARNFVSIVAPPAG